MIKKLITISTVLLFVMILTFGSSLTVYAGTDPSSFLTEGTNGSSNVTSTNSQLKVLGVSIHTLITTGLNIIGLLVLATYGGKWWLAGKDSTRKKELKEEGVNYLIGSIIFFGAAFIYNLIYKLASGFATTTTASK